MSRTEAYVNLHWFCARTHARIGMSSLHEGEYNDNKTLVYKRTCMILPPQTSSRGVWVGYNGEFIQSPIPTLEMQMCIVFFGTLFFHTFLSRLRFPRFTSMIIVSPSSSSKLHPLLISSLLARHFNIKLIFFQKEIKNATLL